MKKQTINILVTSVLIAVLTMSILLNPSSFKVSIYRVKSRITQIVK